MIITDKNAARIMDERFGRDNVVALATSENGTPHVRYVNAFYEDGAFYVITYALSQKMRQLRENPTAALAAEWFTAHGKPESLGWFGDEKNRGIAAKLMDAFAEWIDNGHNNFDDRNTIILKIELTDMVLMSHGTRYEF